MEKVVFGIDIARDTLAVCKDDGTHRQERTLPHDEDGIAAVYTWIQEASGAAHACWCVMEATGNYHLHLAEELTRLGIAVAVINPLVSRRFAEMKRLQNKTDREDAALLARYGHEQPLVAYRPVSPDQEHLRTLNTMLAQLIKQRTALSNLLGSLALNRHHDTRGMEVLHRLLARLKETIKTIEARQQALIERAYPEESRLLRSITGIGPRACTVLLAYAGTLAGYASPKQLIAYAGTNPRNRQSGVSLNQSGAISKQGNPQLRTVLYMASCAASKHNTACRLLHQRLIAAGKKKKQARIAVVNKLLRQAWAVINSGQPYIDGYGIKTT